MGRGGDTRGDGRGVAGEGLRPFPCVERRGDAVETLKKFQAFMQESWHEVRHKVTWPTSREVWGTTGVVVATTLAFAVYLGAVDYIMLVVMKTVFARFQ